MPEVLLVDDERLVARLYARAVEAAGCEATIIDDGETAFARIVEQPPALLITDLSMPGLSGLALVERLQARDLKNFPVVLMSADDNVALLRAGVDAGVDDFLVKGVPFDRLIARLKHWVFGPFAGLPAHVRSAAADSLARVAPPAPPMVRLHGALSRLSQRAGLVTSDLLSMAGADFGAEEVDLVRLLGVVDGMLALLSRSNGLLQLRRLEAISETVASLGPDWTARVQPLLSRYPEIAGQATFRHAAQTLLLRP